MSFFSFMYFIRKELHYNMGIEYIVLVICFLLVNEIIISSSLYRTKKLAAAVYYLNALLT